MADELNAVIAAQEPVVAAQEPVAEPDAGKEPVAPISAPVEQKPVQTHQDNEIAKQARLAAEKVTRDAVIAEVYGSQGITTYEQYQQALAAQQAVEKAAKMELTPEAYAEISSAKTIAQQALEKLSVYEKKELMDKQAATMVADPRYGKFFKENEGEIRKTATELNTDLEIARLMVLDKKYQEPDVETIKKTAIQEYIDGLKRGNKPVEGSGAPPVSVQAEPKTFADARKGSFAILQALKQT